MQISQQFLVGFKKDPQIDITYDLYQLFYPFTNLQSLLFSQIHPFTDIDYKKNKAFGHNQNETICFDTEHDVKMDWNDIKSINKIRDFMQKILSSSSSNQGIKENDLYLMFSSPSPSEIIEQLRSLYTFIISVHCNRHRNMLFRFGILSSLCDVHLDRFGRRSYHYRSNHPHHKKRQSQLHFYNHSKCPSSMFAVGDIVGLSDFISNIDDDSKSEASTYSHSQSVTINFHDNDVVMVSTQNDGKVQNEMKWQNYSIHQYLQRKRAFNVIQETLSPITKKVFSSRRSSPKYKPPPPPNLEKHNSLKLGGVHEKRKRKMTATICKEGFLEKENVRSLANIHNKYWVRYWCVLWNEQLLLYKNQDYIKDDVGRKLKKPIERIFMKKIAVPISVSYDVVGKYHKLTLHAVDSEKKYVFRTKSEHERNGWLQEIDNVLDYENNIGQKQWSPLTPSNPPTLEDKTTSCLIM